MMLILSRKVGESIRIGDDIEITITSIEQNRVRIGIRGPVHLPIYREELYQRIQEENRRAVNLKTQDLDEIIELYSKERKPEQD